MNVVDLKVDPTARLMPSIHKVVRNLRIANERSKTADRAFNEASRLLYEAKELLREGEGNDDLIANHAACELAYFTSKDEKYRAEWAFRASKDQLIGTALWEFEPIKP